MSATLHVVCPECGTVNRLPAPRLHEAPTCGRCHGLLLDGRPIALDAAAFDRRLAHEELPLVVDFWAAWCGPCQAMAPQFERAARALAPQVRCAKVDTDAQSQLAARFGIRSIPTLVLLRGGQEIARHAGAMSEQDIRRWVGAALGTG